MRIGIDIDDTTFNSVDTIMKYADFYEVNELKNKGINGNLDLISERDYIKQLYNWNPDVREDFFRKYYNKILNECAPMENASKIINKLKQEGNEIYFITARLYHTDYCDIEKITESTLKNNNILYDKLVLNMKDKLNYALENGINIFIEDNYELCEELERHGIKTYLMTTRMNKNVITNVERVHSWDELYKKIEIYIKNI